MKKVLSLLFVALLLVGGWFWYNQNKEVKFQPEKQIIGNWYDSENDQTIVFKDNNTFEFTNGDDETRSGKWKIAGKYIKIKVTGASKGSALLPNEEDLEFNYLEFDFPPSAPFEKFGISDGTFVKQ